MPVGLHRFALLRCAGRAGPFLAILEQTAEVPLRGRRLCRDARAYPSSDYGTGDARTGHPQLGGANRKIEAVRAGHPPLSLVVAKAATGDGTNPENAGQSAKAPWPW